MTCAQHWAPTVQCVLPVGSSTCACSPAAELAKCMTRAPLDVGRRRPSRPTQMRWPSGPYLQQGVHAVSLVLSMPIFYDWSQARYNPSMDIHHLLPRLNAPLSRCHNTSAGGLVGGLRRQALPAQLCPWRPRAARPTRRLQRVCSSRRTQLGGSSWDGIHRLCALAVMVRTRPSSRTNGAKTLHLRAITATRSRPGRYRGCERTPHATLGSRSSGCKFVEMSSKRCARFVRPGAV